MLLPYFEANKDSRKIEIREYYYLFGIYLKFSISAAVKDTLLVTFHIFSMYRH